MRRRLALSALVLALSSISGVLAATSSRAGRGRPGNDGFVLAGQSNMVGASTQNEDARAGRVTSPGPDGLLSWSFRGLWDNTWALANEFPCDDAQCEGTDCTFPGENRTVEGHPDYFEDEDGTCICRCGVHVPTQYFEVDAGRGSAWPTFASRWMQLKHRQVWFVASAVGGQCLAASPDERQPGWDPTAMDCRSLAPTGFGVPTPPLSAPGELYCRMVEDAKSAGAPNLRAVLWYQGECDAGAGVRASDYKAALERLADHVWADLGLPMIVAPISRHTRTGDPCLPIASFDEISAATIAAARDHPHIFLGPNSDDLELEPDCTHVHDVVTLGERWFDAVIAAGVAP